MADLIEGAELTYHSDMYSMGVVLYELLTGQKPFSAGSLEMLVQKIMHQVPPAPSTLRAELWVHRMSTLVVMAY